MKFPIKFAQLFGPCLILLLAFVSYLLEPASFNYLAYNRNDLENGQIWRLLTGNILHTNFHHLLLNSAGLVLVWALHGNHYKATWFLLLFTVCSLSACIGMWFSAPEMTSYVGLSGALHGLFVWGALKDIQIGLKSGWLLLLGVAIKVAHEQLTGPSSEVSEMINATVAIDAHLFGALGGLLFFIICFRKRADQS